MELELAGKSALVTGAGAVGGIGAEIARALAREGVSVVVSGRDVPRGEAVVKEILAEGGSVRFVPADLRDVNDVGRLADEAGPVDVLVNNAAALTMGPMVDQGLAAYEESFAVNVRAPYFLTAALAPAMLAKGEGSVINISSLAAKIAMPGMSVYGATKSALEGLTRSWAAEFADTGVRVNALGLGTVDSEKASSVLGEAVFEQLRLATPNRRIGTATEIAQAVLFLASPRSSFVTGATIAIDGGRTIV
ncbi:SDR family NAD(P)-dependent oxidoreductase [Streptomyces sp. NPDC093675]|uniref:SDR family NAD(P)-dependent oxidoreductase n=1 Tax=Streptomyces sp. NPDC093675 TaxID=3366049 RepID=UPI00381F4FFF